MKIGPNVALDDTIADTKFQGSGYTGLYTVVNTLALDDTIAEILYQLSCHQELPLVQISLLYYV